MGMSGIHSTDVEYIMSDALSDYGPEHFGTILGRVQQFLTIHIYQIEELDEEVGSLGLGSGRGSHPEHP